MFNIYQTNSGIWRKVYGSVSKESLTWTSFPLNDSNFYPSLIASKFIEAHDESN